jgi:hypothetical protein
VEAGAERREEGALLLLGTADQDRRQGEVIDHDGSGNTGTSCPQFLDDEAAFEGAQSTSSIGSGHTGIHQADVVGLAIDLPGELAGLIVVHRHGRDLFLGELPRHAP